MRRGLILAALLGTTALWPMPAHAGPVLGFFSGLFAAAGASATTAAVAQAIGGASLFGFKVGSFLFGSGLLSLGLSAAAQALSRQRLKTPEEQQQNTIEQISPMQQVFGTTRKGGPILIHRLVTDAPKARHVAVILAAHRIDGIEQHFLGNRAVRVESGAVLSSPLNDRAWLWARLGVPGQAADAQLVARIPEWTSAHNVRGLAYIHAEFRTVAAADYEKIYGAGSTVIGPSITPAIRGARLFDPRTNTTTFSDNAALVIAWLLTTRGFTVDWANVAEEADIADQLVPNRRGSFQRRWTLNGVVDLPDDFATIEPQITTACDVWWSEKPDGTVIFKLGRWEEPEITLTPEDFTALEFTDGTAEPSAPTEVSGAFVEPYEFWTERHYGPVEIVPADPPRGEVLQLSFVNSPNQAARALKRIAASRRPRRRVTGEVGLIGYELAFQRFVQVETPIDTFYAQVGRITLNPETGGVVFEAAEVDPESWDFDPATEEIDTPIRALSFDENRTALRPTSITGAAGASGVINWTINSPIVSIGGGGVVIELSYRRVGAVFWTTIQFNAGLGAGFNTSGVDTMPVVSLVPGALYEARARMWRGQDNGITQWTLSVAVAAGT